MKRLAPIALLILLAGCTTQETAAEAKQEAKVRAAESAGSEQMQQSGVVQDAEGESPMTPPKSDFYIDL